MTPFKIAVFLVLCYSSNSLAQGGGLIHQYKFDGDLKDAVGESHGEVIPGASTAKALFVKGQDNTENGAITFPLSCAAKEDWYFVKIGNWSPSQLGTPGEMTVTFWGLWYGPSTGCKEGGGGKPQDIITKRDNYKMGDMAWGINQHAKTNHALSVHHPDGKTRATASKGMPESTWVHVAISMDGTNVRFYMNGELFCDTAGTYAKKFDAQIYVGNSTNGTKPNVNDVYNGAMDDLRFYSRKLTDAEVMAVFKPPATALAPVIKVKRGQLLTRTSDYIRIRGLVGEATLRVMDLKGRTLFTKEVTSNGEIIPLPNPAPGIAVMKVKQ